MVRFNGASHGPSSLCRCSYGLEHRRTPSMIRAGKARRHRSPLAILPFFTSQSTDAVNGDRRVRMNLTWCKARCRPVRRVKRLPALRRMRRSSICSRLLHPASMRFMPRFSLEFPMGRQKTAGVVWGEFVANQILAARANDGSDCR